ncbi:MAG: hypothetical protein ACLR4X_04990 [Clostridia bacterium]
MSKYLKKDYKNCQNCLYLHTGHPHMCEFKGVIDLSFETICSKFECFQCNKTKIGDKEIKCECYENEIKAKINLD